MDLLNVPGPPLLVSVAGETPCFDEGSGRPLFLFPRPFRFPPKHGVPVRQDSLFCHHFRAEGLGRVAPHLASPDVGVGACSTSPFAETWGLCTERAHWAFSQDTILLTSIPSYFACICVPIVTPRASPLFIDKLSQGLF